MMKYTALLLSAFLLLGCGGQNSVVLPAPKTPAQSVFELKTVYASALSVAARYRALPDCAAPMHPPLCSDMAIIQKIRDVDAISGPILDTAEKVVRTPGFGADAVQSIITAATNALAAFTQITNTLRTQ